MSDNEMTGHKEHKLDFERDRRLGFGEAIFCANKTGAQITAILSHAAEASQPLLLTRLAPERYEQLNAGDRSDLDYDPVSLTAFYRLDKDAAVRPPVVGIVTAGTSDAWIAHEARRALQFMEVGSHCYFDVGVAGLWRLLERLDEIRSHRVIIAVAGMDAALPSVLGGLLPQPIIAVPTSTGYGAARGGETALAACLSSCAPGVVVCNIDNGYGAATAAMRILGAVQQAQMD